MSERDVPREFDAPFLDAKVRPPAPVAGMVTRPRLVDVLAAGRSTELTLLSGPAGSGKTTLLVDWLRGPGAPSVSWLTLDDRDNDPVNFWTGVLASLAIGARADGAPRLVALADRVRDEPTRLVDAIGQALPIAAEPPVLVLDDYHVIVDEQIHDGVRLAARYLNDRIRIVIATRTTPPLALGRLRSHGRLCELRFDDLRFTSDEGFELFDRLGIERDVERDTSEAIIASTEGWAVALYVAAVGERRRRAAGAPAETDLSHRHLSEYLVEEVLADASPEHGDFLLKTSVLDPLSVERCNAVTTRSDAAAVLHALERSTQFIRRQDADGRWFRCHSLLRELLLAEAERRGLDLAELRRRAAAAAIREGDQAAAIDALLDAQDAVEAAQVIGRSWIDHTNRGRFGTVMTWVERWAQLPQSPATTATDPTVPVVGAWAALHTGRLDEVEHWLDLAQRTEFAGQLADGSSSLRSAVAIVRNSHRRRAGDVDAALRAAEIAVAEEIGSESAWSAVALVGRGATRYWSGDDDGAQSDLEAAIEFAERARLNVPQIMGSGYLALLAHRNGDLVRARALAEDGVTRAEQHRLATYDQAAAPMLALALSLLADTDLDGADARLSEAERLAAVGHERLLIAATQLARAELALIGDGHAAFASMLNSARESCARCPDPGILRADLDRALARRRDSGGGAHLTDREHVILRFLASRLSIPDIARELDVSPNTVKTQAAAVRSKLGATSRAEAVRLARESGLLP